MRRKLIRGFTVFFKLSRRPPGRSLSKTPGLKRTGNSGHESEMVVVHDRFLECFNHWYFAWVLFVGGGSFFSEGGHT